MARRKKRNQSRRRNHYRQSTSRRLGAGLENLERRALLTGLVGWADVMDHGATFAKEEAALETIAKKHNPVQLEKQVAFKTQKATAEHDKKEHLVKKDRQATFMQDELDFDRCEIPTGHDFQRIRPGVSGDYHFKRYDVFPGAWIVVVTNQPNEHHHQDSNENGRTNINTFVYDNYTVTFWENPDGTIGEIMIENDGDQNSSDTSDQGNTNGGDTTSGSNNNPGTNSGLPSGGNGSFSGTDSSGSDSTIPELDTPPEGGSDETPDPGDPPITRGQGEGDDETEGDDDDDTDNDEGDEEEEEGGESSGGEGDSNANNDVILLPTPLDEIIIEDDTGDDNDNGGSGGEPEEDNETIECPDPPPGGSAPTHPNC